jgi:hypothetical protein
MPQPLLTSNQNKTYGQPERFIIHNNDKDSGNETAVNGDGKKSNALKLFYV